MKKIIVLMLMVFSSAFSQNGNAKARFLITGSLEFGGDEVGHVYFSDGSVQSINSGQGGTIAIGGELDFPNSKGFFLRGTVGYKYVTTKADNVHVRLTRVPLELTVNYNIVKKFWIGTGVLTHAGIKLNFDGLAPNEKFTSNTGIIFKLGYGGLGISFTNMKYKGSRNDVYNANSFGMFFTIPIKEKNWKS